jgi:Fur family ferric uptake transcriptional regulator/Fur family peroxide stress response transcriptional regulator
VIPKRKSRQRERILEILRDTKTHPTAEAVHARLRRDMPRVSLGTVYRNLGQLAAQGLVRRIAFGASVDRFEANVLSHHHFVCDRCGAVADLEVPVDATLTRKLARAAGVKADRHEIRLYGTCARCTRGG